MRLYHNSAAHAGLVSSLCLAEGLLGLCLTGRVVH